MAHVLDHLDHKIHHEQHSALFYPINNDLIMNILYVVGAIVFGISQQYFERKADEQEGDG